MEEERARESGSETTAGEIMGWALNRFYDREKIEEGPPNCQGED